MKTPLKILSIITLFFLYNCSNSSKIDDQKKLIVSASSGLRMRDTPSTSGKRVTTIPNNSKVIFLEDKGEMITISNHSGKWTKISWNGKTGWVFGGFLNEFNSNETLKIKSDEVTIPIEFQGKWKKPKNQSLIIEDDIIFEVQHPEYDAGDFFFCVPDKIKKNNNRLDIQCKSNVDYKNYTSKACCDPINWYEISIQLNSSTELKVLKPSGYTPKVFNK